MDLGHHSTLVRTFLFFYALISRILMHEFMYKGVYGALFVAGMASTVFAIGEMVVVRTCLSLMTDLGFKFDVLF